VATRYRQSKCDHNMQYRGFMNYKSGWAYECTKCGAKSRNGMQGSSFRDSAAVTTTVLDFRTGKGEVIKMPYNEFMKSIDSPGLV
jgi:hypothetical protein